MNKKWMFGILIALIGLSFTFSNKKIEIKGVVVDSSSLPLIGANVLEKGTKNGVITDIDGQFTLTVQEGSSLVVSYTGYDTQTIKATDHSEMQIVMKEGHLLDEVVVTEYVEQEIVEDQLIMSLRVPMVKKEKAMSPSVRIGDLQSTTAGYAGNLNYHESPKPQGNESYQEIKENGYKQVTEEPLSTFSIDVDRAAYSNVRRYIENGAMPPKDAVRIEEMINYFDYDYEGPQDNTPFAVHTELVNNPWKAGHELLHIGVQGKKYDKKDLPNSNIVFLLDVSGSMNDMNKLPLVKSSLRMLTQQLRKDDRVAIVVYAGAAGLVLPSTSGTDKQAIIDALDELSAGGSTAGGAGIELAYKVAKENFIKGGNNRIILATDGDFNVGRSSDKDMATLIEKKRKTGIFLSVLGFGMGNYKDSKMQELADKGNGNHAYIDNIHEARKTLVQEFGSTLFTIAKDVKIQIEFNPTAVKSYRLIGYENRMLAKEDFNNDKKDAGELGAGHVVTAIYEIERHGSSNPVVDDLKYQNNQQKDHVKELATVKLRYKQPDGDKSKKIEVVVANEVEDFDRVSKNVRWSTSVAGFGMMLRDSDHKGDVSYIKIIEKARAAKGKDTYGYQGEFIKLVESVEAMYPDMAAEGE